MGRAIDSYVTAEDYRRVNAARRARTRPIMDALASTARRTKAVTQISHNKGIRSASTPCWPPCISMPFPD